MKLAATLLATLASVNEATITCAGGKELFEVTCSAADGFDIKINDACRQSFFPFVDFANSFVWGDAAVVKMADYTANTSDGVVAGSSTATPAITCTPKLAATGSVKDSSGTDNAFNLKVPFTDCKVAATTKADGTTGNKYIEYALYWNSQTVDAITAPQLLYQIGQVKMVCRIDPYQEDSVSVTVTEDTAIADPAEKRVDLAADLELEVGKFDFTDANKFDTTAATDTAVTNTAGGTLGQAITYTAVANGGAVKLGDYMQLLLKDTGSNSILTKYSVSLEKCWASVAATATSDATAAGGTWYADTSTANQADEFVFWDDFCSKYNDWVGPNTVANKGYLKETTDHAHSIHAVHFRQFGFLSQQANYVAGTTGKEMYYHCFVKVCPIADEATCTKFKLDGTTPTACTASKYTAPARKRRSDEPAGTLGMTAEVNVETVNNLDCAKTDSTNTVCLAKSAPKESSSAKSTCAATSLMALLTGAILR